MKLGLQGPVDSFGTVRYVLCTYKTMPRIVDAIVDSRKDSCEFLFMTRDENLSEYSICPNDFLGVSNLATNFISNVWSYTTVVFGWNSVRALELYVDQARDYCFRWYCVRSNLEQVLLVKHY